MKTVIVVQARMTSTRLPGKVLKDLAGRPMLAQQVRRLQRCAQAQEIVIATTINESDDPVVEMARRLGVRYFRGNEADVLSRFVGAARETQADVIVRVTADCPLIDPVVTDRVIEELVAHSALCDYASNVIRRTYPRGLDAEAFFYDTLLRMDRFGTSPAAREHVTVVARSERPAVFLCRDVLDTVDNADLRWTVDTPADLEMVRTLYGALNLNERWVTHEEIVAYVRRHPEIATINAGIETWDPTQPL